jgi:hypothetical protein
MHWARAVMSVEKQFRALSLTYASAWPLETRTLHLHVKVPTGSLTLLASEYFPKLTSYCKSLQHRYMVIEFTARASSWFPCPRQLVGRAAFGSCACSNDGGYLRHHLDNMAI